MEILNSTIEDIDTLFRLYEAATAYQKEVGIKKWKGFERALVEQEIQEKRQYKIIEDGKIACVFVITYNDPLIWKEADADPAIYIHRIATNPDYRGRSYVKHIVNWAKKHAAEQNRKFIRMDTGSGNDRLNNYYISCGFTYKGITGIEQTEGLPEHYKNGTFSLFEIDLSKLAFYHVDAFTDQLFEGNPACVVPLENWLPDAILQKIAKENAVPETVFFIPEGRNFHIRWFTPEHEMDLCGHATLATAHILKTELYRGEDKFRFHSKSGLLEVEVNGDQFTLNFPSRKPVAAELPAIISASLSKQPKQVLKSRDYVLVYDTEQEVRELVLDRAMLEQIDLKPGGIIATAKGELVDFVSRFFIPQASIFEDPVTGSAHCSLIPYWSEQLDKTEMDALQVSERGGKLRCEQLGDRVLITGTAVTYASGLLKVF
ncbi:PhzF family phenazine biosynthesis isomerase [Pedobacter frigoris]|nr:PhzF family phenazine biosynthesis isomerase [Pedobacter frigoris]